MPRTQVTETTLYQFDELSETAKDTAREWFRNGISEDFADFGADSVLEDASTIAEMLGIRINTRAVPLMNGTSRREPVFHWEVGSYRGTDGASFTGYYSYKAGAVKAVKAYAPKDEKLHEIAKSLQAIQRPYFYRLQACIESNRYYRGVDSARMSVTVKCDGAGYLESRTEEDLQDVIRAFADWIGDRLTAEWDYQHSDECVAENIRANEYEFNEDGERI
jgi:hypothetical protein